MPHYPLEFFLLLLEFLLVLLLVEPLLKPSETFASDDVSEFELLEVSVDVAVELDELVPDVLDELDELELVDDEIEDFISLIRSISTRPAVSSSSPVKTRTSSQESKFKIGSTAMR